MSTVGTMHGGVIHVPLNDDSPSESERGKQELLDFLRAEGKDAADYRFHLRKAWDPVLDQFFQIMCAYPKEHPLADA